VNFANSRSIHGTDGSGSARLHAGSLIIVNRIVDCVVNTTQRRLDTVTSRSMVVEQDRTST
jgi:hypothetical protein